MACSYGLTHTGKHFIVEWIQTTELVLSTTFCDDASFPLRHDTTIFALVQILVEVAFPKQEIRYIQAAIKHTNAYRKPRFGMPAFLKERAHTVQGICLANIDKGMAVPKFHIKEESTGVIPAVRSSSTQDTFGSEH